MAWKVLNENDAVELLRQYDTLKLSTANNKEKKLLELYSKYETNLEYLGSTAIEDKL